MKTDKEALQRFFSRKAQWNRSTPQALDVLLPFYAMADAGRYDLLYGPRLNVSDVCCALWDAVGADAKGVVLAPTCVPVAEPPPWTDARPQALQSRLFERFAERRASALPTDVSNELQIAFEASLGEPLRGALMVALAKSPHVRQDAWSTVRYALSSYVVLALIGDPAANDLLPLLAVLEQAIPMAPLPGKTRIWSVLTG